MKGKKVPEENCDAIIIGSGTEKNMSPGGSMNTFPEPETGYWTWSPGVQWVCDYAETSTDFLLIKAITDGNVSFCALDDECQINISRSKSTPPVWSKPLRNIDPCRSFSSQHQTPESKLSDR